MSTNSNQFLREIISFTAILEVWFFPVRPSVMHFGDKNDSLTVEREETSWLNLDFS